MLNLSAVSMSASKYVGYFPDSILGFSVWCFSPLDWTEAYKDYAVTTGTRRTK